MRVGSQDRFSRNWSVSHRLDAAFRFTSLFCFFLAISITERRRTIFAFRASISSRPRFVKHIPCFDSRTLAVAGESLERAGP